MDSKLSFDLTNCFHQNSMAQLEKLLRLHAFQIIPFNGVGVVDKASFLTQIIKDFPVDEGCQPKSWDGFVDCLWRGLYPLESQRVALIWQSAHVLLESNLQTFLTINRLLSDISRSVSTTENGFSHEMWFVTFLLGESNLFPNLPST